MSTRRCSRLRQILRSACRALILLAAMAVVTGARPRSIPDGPTGTVTDSVVRPDRPKYLENPGQRARVGTRCEIHRWTRLKLDLVPVHYGFVGYTPGLGGDERFEFPNAHPWSSGGCVDHGIVFAEVAYCTECRAAWNLWQLRATIAACWWWLVSPKQ